MSDTAAWFVCGLALGSAGASLFFIFLEWWRDCDPYEADE